LSLVFSAHARTHAFTAAWSLSCVAAGLIALPLVGAYCISKHAAEALNAVLRRELSPFGIRVSAIEVLLWALSTPLPNIITIIIHVC
jgi:NAD(P)-dependent dehydrogenase (short-subunit alcohol dehydrogenase family)